MEYSHHNMHQRYSRKEIWFCKSLEFDNYIQEKMFFIGKPDQESLERSSQITFEVDCNQSGENHFPPQKYGCHFRWQKS
ncbi:CLUMA_CG015972, isoform A [Clunio marinus]|uniref:CLUMA_CG015972, isoform A n=1 Tax=Clunio marinus TaxID=568069 RepID=A0A1J1IRD7_9DIPT|nr:CLUMA_CG015972, isoform A [Clunio marinus]